MHPKRFALAAFVAASVAALSAFANAGLLTPTRTAAHVAIPAAKWDQLEDFVRLATGYKVTSRPNVVFKTRDQINRFFYGSGYNGQTDIIAVTTSGVMFLPDTLKLPDQDDVLVHELVHFMQFESGKRAEVACAAALEPEAYHVQDVFNAARGYDTRSDAFTVLVLSECPH